jgi:hypothetical protein
MTAPFGWSPLHHDIILSLGGDWVFGFTPENADGTAGTSFGWTTGTTVTLIVGADTWPATVTTTLVSWHVDSTVTDPVPEGTPVHCFVSEPTTPDTTDLLWWKGTVRRDD